MGKRREDTEGAWACALVAVAFAVLAFATAGMDEPPDRPNILAETVQYADAARGCRGLVNARVRCIHAALAETR